MTTAITAAWCRYHHPTLPSAMQVKKAPLKGNISVSVAGDGDVKENISEVKATR